MVKKIQMTNEELVKDILTTFKCYRLPIDPFILVEQEEIRLVPGQYGEGFDARIEYIEWHDQYLLFYKDSKYGVSEGRLRFSISHELGHYFLPKHRQLLLRGESHNSVTGFRSVLEREREADEFAATLLMPMELFLKEVKSKPHGICTLSEIASLAATAFRTSVTATTLRYVKSNLEPCSLVVSEEGKICWSISSEDMKDLGMGYIRYQSPVPATTPTFGLYKATSIQEFSRQSEGSVNAHLWYPKAKVNRLWEDTIYLGNTGRILTLLTPE